VALYHKRRGSSTEKLTLSAHFFTHFDDPPLQALSDPPYSNSAGCISGAAGA
jgi:hypothetical protein